MKHHRYGQEKTRRFEIGSADARRSKRPHRTIMEITYNLAFKKRQPKIVGQFDQPGRVTCDVNKLLECGIRCAFAITMSRKSEHLGI
jgi:hypothetical protein